MEDCWGGGGGVPSYHLNRKSNQAHKQIEETVEIRTKAYLFSHSMVNGKIFRFCVFL